jgi:hypothetical protein
MKNGQVAQYEVSIAEKWRNQDLMPVSVREDKRLPFAEIGGLWVTVNNYQIESSVVTRD